MSIIRVGLSETERFGEGWDAIFGKGGKKPTQAKSTKAAKVKKAPSKKPPTKSARRKTKK